MTRDARTYILGHTGAEHERLRAQALVWQFATERVLDHLDVRDGMRCLDIGCGPGAVMRLLAERVGPSGHVTGLDLDGEVGRAAEAELRATGHETCTFIEGDVTRVDEVPGAPFDLVYARTMLLHLADPVAALRKMHAWTKPGGVVVAQDVDLRTAEVIPPSPGWAEWDRVFSAVAEGGGVRLDFGVQLPGYFVAAGLGRPDGTDVAGLLQPLADLAPIFAASYRSVLPLALENGITTQAAADSFLTEFAAAAAEGSYEVMGPLLISAWKRKAT